MKARIIMGFVLLLLFTGTLTGCGDMTQLEDRDFVLVLGMEKVEKQYRVTYVMPDYAAISGEGGEAGENTNLTFTGDSLTEIEEKYALQSSKRLDYSHLKAVVIGKNLGQDSKMLGDFLNDVKENYEMGRNTLVFLGNDSPESIIEKSQNTGGDIGTWLEQMQQNNRQKKSGKTITLGDMITAWNNKDEVLLLPALELREENAVVSGGGFFSQKGFTDTVKEDSLLFIELAQGEGVGRILTLHDGSCLEFMEVQEGLKIVRKNDLPTVILKIDGTVEKKLIQKDKNGLSYDYNQIIENGIVQKMNYYIKQNKIDFLNLYRACALKNKKLWKQYEGKQENFLEDIKIEVEASFRKR